MPGMDEGRQDDEVPTRWTVPNGDREVQFIGLLLGEASSADDVKPRWAEIRIFRTTSNRYVVAGVGRSQVNGEIDKHWVRVHDEPNGVIESMHLLDDHDSRYMPHVNKRALEQAIDKDDRLRQAYAVEVVD